MGAVLVPKSIYLAVPPASHFTPRPGASWPVAAGDPHYRALGGIYAPFKSFYRPHVAQRPDNAAIPGRMQARWFRTQVPQGVFPAQELDMHYLTGRSRSAKPVGTIVRISGLGSNSMVDEGLDERLLENFNVIVIDIPGTGLTSWMRNSEGKSFSPEDYDAVPQSGPIPKAVQATLEIARPQIGLVNHQLAAWGETGKVFGFGHSMGAMIMMFMLTGHEVLPESMQGISGALLANTYASDGKVYDTPAYVGMMARKVPNTHDWWGFPKFLSALISGVGAFAVMGYFARNRAFAPIAAMVSRAMFTHMPRSDVNPDFSKERIDAQTVMARIIHDALKDEDSTRLMHELQSRVPVPVRVILSGNDPLMIPERVKPGLETSIPEIQVTVFPEEGHLLPQENPEMVERELLALAQARIGSDTANE